MIHIAPSLHDCVYRVQGEADPRRAPAACGVRPRCAAPAASVTVYSLCSIVSSTAMDHCLLTMQHRAIPIHHAPVACSRRGRVGLRHGQARPGSARPGLALVLSCAVLALPRPYQTQPRPGDAAPSRSFLPYGPWTPPAPPATALSLHAPAALRPRAGHGLHVFMNVRGLSAAGRTCVPKASSPA